MPRTRTPAPVERPVVLTVAGSDSGGGAGVQADLKTIEACGGFGTSAVTAVTAQHTRGVESSHVLPTEELEAQLDAVLADFDVRAVKTGMLATREVIETVAGYAADLDAPVVVDPVMVAASGDRLLTEGAEDAYEELIAAAALVTPNADEAAILTGSRPEDEASARAAGRALREVGAGAALVKGGHVPGETVNDVLVTGDGVETFAHPRVETEATHGSGCALSAAVATHLARGTELGEAVASSVDLLARAIRYHHDVGEGPGAVHHLVSLRNEAARHPTAEAVERLVERLVERDVSALVPEVGMNVAGATPFAEESGECAAVEGRITRTLSGVEPTRGVRFGASGHVARFLLAAREHHPGLRFAANCRFDDDIARALDALDGVLVEYDRRDQPDAVRREEGSTMGWVAARAFGDREDRPVAVADRGAHGKEPMVRFVAADAGTLADRLLVVLDELD